VLRTGSGSNDGAANRHTHSAPNTLSWPRGAQCCVHAGAWTGCPNPCGILAISQLENCIFNGLRRNSAAALGTQVMKPFLARCWRLAPRANVHQHCNANVHGQLPMGLGDSWAESLDPNAPCKWQNEAQLDPTTVCVSSALFQTSCQNLLLQGSGGMLETSRSKYVPFEMSVCPRKHMIWFWGRVGRKPPGMRRLFCLLASALFTCVGLFHWLVQTSLTDALKQLCVLLFQTSLATIKHMLHMLDGCQKQAAHTWSGLRPTPPGFCCYMHDASSMPPKPISFSPTDGR